MEYLMLAIWLAAGISQLCSCLCKHKADWVSYWLLYAGFMSYLVCNIFGN